MLSLDKIINDEDGFAQQMQKRGINQSFEEILKLANLKKDINLQIQELRTKRNEIAKKIALAKKNNEDSKELFSESKIINDKIKLLEKSNEYDIKLDEILHKLPNYLSPEVPLGESENDNKLIEKWGDIPKFSFQPKEHYELGVKLGLMDFEKSALLSGARFSILTGELAKLERALANFMIDVANEHGYLEIAPPYLVNNQTMFGSGQLPKFADDAYKTNSDHWLIPTSEVSLVNMVANSIVDFAELPIKMVAHTPCFRKESGSAGKDTRGMIRQHQFKKVELIAITDEESSFAEHENMTNVACEILRRLNLPYRKMLLCSKDTGFCAAKTYDLEVWLPGQNKYREISSCSNCEDFQSRRMKARYRKKGDKKIHFVHSLNGSALAVGRTLIAIMENYQQQDGTIKLPEILSGYMGETKIINIFPR